MKISKKVMIKRNPEQVWACLFNTKSSKKKSQQKELSSFKKDELIKFKGHKDLWQIIGSDKTKKLKLHRHKRGSNVSIDIKLTPYRTRTELRFTLSGWEKADAETKKNDIPKLSLSWEKTLSTLKKEAESKR